MSKNLERLSGDGDLLVGNRPVAHVRYRARVDQDIVRVQTSSGVENLGGGIEVTGSFGILSGSIPDNAGDLVLRLNDGRTIPIFIDDGDWPSGPFSFVARGELK